MRYLPLLCPFLLHAQAPTVTVVPTPEPTRHLAYRRTLVGPGVNEPAVYPGYLGFVGWEAVVRTKTGALVMTFTSGYWHASFPTPYRGVDPRDIERYVEMGMPKVEAPRGGRAEVMRSEDGGKTWSKPTVMIDTEFDDRSPAAALLPDGTLVATLFTYPHEGCGRAGVIRSFDDGRTWEQTVRYLPGFACSSGDGPPLVMPDGSILIVMEGANRARGDNRTIGVWRSRDKGANWELTGAIRAEFDQYEPSIARLPDGRLIVVTRREGALSWSSDDGVTWTPPVKLPFKLFDPWLLLLRDGTLLCVHGSYHKQKRGVRAILSRDGGKSWMAAGEDFGFAIDPSTYGYSRGMQLPDGSIYMVYIHTGGHKTADAKNQSIFALRFRVRPDASGVELLPAPGGAKPGKARNATLPSKHI